MENQENKVVVGGIYGPADTKAEHFKVLGIEHITPKRGIVYACNHFFTGVSFGMVGLSESFILNEDGSMYWELKREEDLTPKESDELQCEIEKNERIFGVTIPGRKELGVVTKVPEASPDIFVLNIGEFGESNISQKEERYPFQDKTDWLWVAVVLGIIVSFIYSC